MAAKKLSRSTQVPLIVEPHPEDYDGYPFITLIKYRDHHTLNIVDNSDDKTIKSYVLDMCGPEEVDEESVISIAAEWHETSKAKYPISFEFSKRGISETMSKILRSYNIDFVTRVIGPLPSFEMKAIKATKCRRRKQVPAGVAVNRKVISLT